MTTTTPQPTPTPAPKPRPSTPWNDPGPITPSGPRLTPDAYVDAVSDLRGIHIHLTIHLGNHGDACGPTCATFAQLHRDAGAVLNGVRPTSRLNDSTLAVA